MDSFISLMLMTPHQCVLFLTALTLVPNENFCDSLISIYLPHWAMSTLKAGPNPSESQRKYSGNVCAAPECLDGWMDGDSLLGN